MSGSAHATADVVVVGAGPAGLFAVFACGQLGLRCAVVDALADPGGQLSALYPEKPIYDIPSRPEVRADALVADLLAQARPYAPQIFLKETAVGLVEAGGRFTLETSAGRRIGAGAVILAAGAGAFGPNRPPLPGIEAYEDRSVFYHVARRERFRGLDVVIAGGGDSAVDWALSLAEVAASVAVVHRRDAFRAHPASVEAMRADPRIRLVVPRQIEALEGEDGALRAVRVAPIGGGASERLPAQALVALFGLATDLSPLARFGIATDGKTIPVDPVACETARPGVFAIGDVASYPGKLKLILTGFAEAAAAANAARARLRPGEDFHFEYSTTRGAPSLAPAPSA